MFKLAQTRKPDVSLNVGFMGGLFREIRRKDRVWDDGRAWELLVRGEYGFLSLCGTNDYGYGMRCREKASIFIARPKGTNWSASGRTIGRVSASSGIPGSFRKGSLPSTGA